jgi:hypothetical protein
MGTAIQSIRRTGGPFKRGTTHLSPPGTRIAAVEISASTGSRSPAEGLRPSFARSSVVDQTEPASCADLWGHVEYYWRSL